MQMMTATVKRAPRSRPGKKPASTAGTEKLFFCFSGAAIASDEVCDAAAGLLLVGLGLSVEEAAADVDLAVLDVGLVEGEAADRIRQLPPVQS